MNADTTVYVVDDQEGVRRALKRLIESVGYRVEASATAAEFLSIHDPARPGCVVLDVRMPGMSGLDLQDALAQRNQLRPIVFITGHGDVPMSVRAMKNGAVDFIQKPFNDQTLLDAIAVAVERDVELRRSRTEREDAQKRVALLTPREREVLQLVVAGKLNKQIGAQLGASEKTIKVHRGRVMRKMQASSLAELVVLAQQAGIHAGAQPEREPLAEPQQA